MSPAAKKCGKDVYNGTIPWLSRREGLRIGIWRPEGGAKAGKIGMRVLGFPAHTDILRYPVVSLEAHDKKIPRLGQRSSIFAQTWEAPGSRGEFLPNGR